MKYFLTLLAFLAPALAYAGAEQLSEEEFRNLAAELAPKVNLFRDAWEKDPAAEFYGGTTRDYLYWVKGQFRTAGTRAEAEAKIATLRKLPVIDVRSFIIGDSDVDIFSARAGDLRAETYGVRKIDYQNKDTLDPKTELGKSELQQGFVPAEKIRLGKDGFHQEDVFGNGLREIHRGPLTVHFASPDDFAQSKYAKEGINHPILLALRYLRLQAIDYYHQHGAGYPKEAFLRGALDPASAKAVRAVVEKTLDGKELSDYIARPRFLSWLNGGIQKAFRSYTNPDAAKWLLHEFRVDELPVVYAGKVEPVNQYVFSQFRDEAKINAALEQAHVDRGAFFRPVPEQFPDGYLYHGTRTEPAFRSILFQGVLGSSGGSAGEGLYGVNKNSQKFSEQWGGSPDRLVRFPVKEDARIVDVREGEGKRVFDGFHNDYEKFAETYGVDLVRYPYGEPQAFVVKNSAALGKPEGVHRQILTLPEILAKAEGISDPGELIRLLSVNNLTDREASLVVARTHLDPAKVEELVRSNRNLGDALRFAFGSLPEEKRLSLATELLEKWRDVDVGTALPILLRDPIFPANEAFLNRVIDRIEAMKYVQDQYPLFNTLIKDGLGASNAPRFPQLFERILGSPWFQRNRNLPAALLQLPKWQSPEIFRALWDKGEYLRMGAVESLSNPGWERFPEVVNLVATQEAYHEMLANNLVRNPQWRIEWPGKEEALAQVKKLPALHYIVKYLLEDPGASSHHRIVENAILNVGGYANASAILASLNQSEPWHPHRDAIVRRYLNDDLDHLSAVFFAEVEPLLGNGVTLTREELRAYAKKAMDGKAGASFTAEFYNHLTKANLWLPEWTPAVDASIDQAFAGKRDWYTHHMLAVDRDVRVMELYKARAKEWLQLGDEVSQARLKNLLLLTRPGTFSDLAHVILNDPRWRGTPLEAAALDNARIVFDQLGNTLQDFANWRHALRFLRERPAFRTERKIRGYIQSGENIHRYLTAEDAALKNLVFAEAGVEPGKRLAWAIEAAEYSGAGALQSFHQLVSQRIRADYPKDSPDWPGVFRQLFTDRPLERQNRLFAEVREHFDEGAGQFLEYSLHPHAHLKETTDRLVREFLKPAERRAMLLRAEAARGPGFDRLSKEIGLAEYAAKVGDWDEGYTRWLKRTLAAVKRADAGPLSVDAGRALLRLQRDLDRWRENGPAALRSLLAEEKAPVLNERAVRGKACDAFYGRL